MRCENQYYIRIIKVWIYVECNERNIIHADYLVAIEEKCLLCFIWTIV
jgi:hypothetical protein